MRFFWAFCKDETGATSIEYAMIATLISLAVIAGATTIGSRLNSKYVGPVSNGLS